MNEQKKINISVTVEETNLLLEALGNLSFNRVYQLVGKLQQDAANQLNGNEENQISDSKNNDIEAS